MTDGYKADRKPPSQDAGAERRDERYAGMALLVSNDYEDDQKLNDLHCTHVDSDSFAKLLKEDFMYRVTCKRNLSLTEFTESCKRIAEYHYSETCNRVVVYFSGHGGQDSLILQDGQEIPIEDLIAQFKPTIAGNATLSDTVRMFFIDACRGEKEEHGHKFSKCSPSCGTASSSANVILAYASLPNYKAFINPSGTGSCWTRCLVKAFRESKEEDEIHDILHSANIQLLNELQGEQVQTPEIASRGITKKVHFRKEAKSLKKISK